MKRPPGRRRGGEWRRGDGESRRLSAGRRLLSRGSCIERRGWPLSAIEAADEDVAKAGAGRHTGVGVTATDGVVGSVLEVVVTVGSMSESS